MLDEQQKESIIHDHFRFKKVVVHYFNNTSFSRLPSRDEYFLYSLENDMIRVLNDNVPLMCGLSDLLKTECPHIAMSWLLSPADKLQERVYTLWKSMTFEKKRVMYTRL